jgi:nitrogen fixation protein FixH
MTKPLFSWGVGITIVYSAFALATLGVVAFSFTQKVDLVADNYYKQELQFQQRINESTAAQALEKPLSWNFSDDRQSILITFPDAAKATITLYRPSNSAHDKTFAVIAGEDGRTAIPLHGLRAGFWRIQIHWETGGKKFYNEFSINV